MGCNFFCPREREVENNYKESNQNKSKLHSLNNEFQQKFNENAKLSCLVDFNKNILKQIIMTKSLEKQNLTAEVLNEMKRDQNIKQNLAAYIQKFLTEQGGELFSQVVTQYLEFLQQQFGLQNSSSNFVVTIAFKIFGKDEQFSLDLSTNLSIRSDNSFYSQQSPLLSIYDTPKGLQKTSQKFSQENKRANYDSSFTTKYSKTYRKPTVSTHWLLDAEACDFFVEQLSFIFGFLHAILDFQLIEFFDEFLTVDPDELPDREMFIQKIIQHHLFDRRKALPIILPSLLDSYYKHRQRKKTKNGIKTTSIHSPPNLKNSLIPKEQDNDEFMIQSYDSSLEQKQILPFMQSHGLETISEHYYEDQEDIYDRNSKSIIQQQMIDQIKNSKNLNVPYKEVFPYLVRLYKTSKFWKKFKRITQIDQAIVYIYMRQRSQSQQGKFYDTISAEDSKSDILLFILHKFSQTIQNTELQLELYQSLKFMYDFDTVLHKDIKYIHCPCFLRFFEMMELLLQQ